MYDSPTTRHSLLVRLRDPGNGQAWDEFVTIYDPLIKDLAKRMGLQDADASDLAQEVFGAVAGAINRWDPDPARGSFRAWLFRIARNLTINFLTAQARRPRGTGDTDTGRLLQAHPARDDDSLLFDQDYKVRVLGWALDQVRDEFSEPIWRSFWLTAVEGRAPREVAESLGMTVGTIYQYKSRVMARVRQRIEQVEGRNEL